MLHELLIGVDKALLVVFSSIFAEILDFQGLSTSRTWFRGYPLDVSRLGSCRELRTFHVWNTLEVAGRADALACLQSLGSGC